MSEWTDPRSSIWNGLKLSARFRVTEAMKHILAHGSLNRADIQRIGEVSNQQASNDIREIIKRTSALDYDVRDKCYVLKAHLKPVRRCSPPEE